MAATTLDTVSSAGAQRRDEGAPLDALGPQPWSAIWHLPVLLLGLGLVAVGVFATLPSAEPDDFKGALDSAAKFLVANNFEEAAGQLDRIAPKIDRAADDEQARFHRLSGDLIYLKQHGKPWLAIPSNHQAIIDSYHRAQELSPPLDATHLQRLAESLVALQRDQEALAVLDTMKDADAQQRYAVVRRVIESRSAAARDDPQGLLALIERFLEEVRQEQDVARRRAARVWATAMKARITMDAGDADGAGRELEQAMIRFMNEGGDNDLAPLMVPLAASYQANGQFEEAQRWHRLAQQKMDAGDPLNAEVLVGLGQIALAAEGDDHAALEHFTAAEINYPSTPSYLTALLGRADAEARLGMHPEANRHFARAVERHMANPLRADKDRRRIEALIQSHFDRTIEGDEFDRALDYLALLKPLYPQGLPDDKLAMRAATHEKLAEQRWAQGRGQAAAPSDPGHATDPAAADAARRLARQEAAIHYERAGDDYLEHARAVTLKDDGQFGQSLWKAATDYDKAQRWKRAIEVYAQFINARPTDPRRLDAIHRLGLAFQADKQYQAAIDLFTQLVEEHARTTQAYNSLVPLAQCHVALGQIDHAERVLQHVVTDHPAITPESAPYQQALVQLGKLLHRQGEFEPAIERLSEAVERYGSTPEAPQVRFLLGDAYRLSVDELDKALQQPMPQSKRVALQSERTRRLEQARMLFSQVIAELETKPFDALSSIEKLYLRNAYFYRADAMYDLGRFDEAINLYDLAARRWEHHPASLIALVQIVNAYAELGQAQEAKVANDRARWQLNRLPDDAFNDPTLPMSRQHWQDWLKWTSELRLFDAQQAVGS